MDRETRLFAENYFRGAGSRLPAAGCPRPQQVDFIEAPDALSYADFVKRYLLPNVPCVFSQAFTESWGCRKRWVTPSGQPDWEYLLQNYGERRSLQPQFPLLGPGSSVRPSPAGMTCSRAMVRT